MSRSFTALNYKVGTAGKLLARFFRNTLRAEKIDNVRFEAMAKDYALKHAEVNTTVRIGSSKPVNVDAMKTLWEQCHAFEKQIDVGNDEDVRSKECLSWDEFLVMMAVIGQEVIISSKPTKSRVRQKKVPKAHALFDIRVEQLDIPLRVLNAVRHGSEIHHLGDLAKLSTKEAQKLFYIGPSGYQHLVTALDAKGLAFGTDVGDWVSPKQRTLLS